MLEMYSRTAALHIGTLKPPFSSQAAVVVSWEASRGSHSMEGLLNVWPKIQGVPRKTYRAFSLWSFLSPHILLCIYYCSLQFNFLFVLYPFPWSLKIAPSRSLNIWRAHSLNFSSLKDQSPLWISTQAWKQKFHIFVHFYNSFQWEVSLIIMIPSWKVSGLSLHCIFQFMINYLNGDS